ncbi:hypothetical protein [Actinoplanes sp. NPDC051859]|uniref:hypothetical protein n=1 Tax=Actinoplanes sp. NPDC051859 TaxID=3363909 RepID=UPI00379C88DD
MLTHQHGEWSTANALLLAISAVLVLVVLALLLRPPRIREEARWRLSEQERRRQLEDEDLRG